MASEKKSDNIIGFWKPVQQGGWMSQWYDSRFVIDGIEYNCCEQYMMAKKAELFGDKKIMKQIMGCRDPNKMKRLGRAVKGFSNSVWEKECFGIVCDGNYAKFSQNAGLLKLLMATGDAILAEASPFDKVWGIGITIDSVNFRKSQYWKGRNLLGQAIMKVRERLSEEAKSARAKTDTDAGK